MRAPAFLLAVLVTVVAPGAFAGEASDPATDLTVRYVNNEVITWGDVQLQMETRRQESVLRGQVLPRTRSERIEFCKMALDELTGDTLLTQRAREMGILADHDDIVLQVLTEAKRNGFGLSLRDQAEKRRRLERKRTIDQIVLWYNSMMPQPRPQDLLDIYNSGAIRQDLPDRAKLLQIILRPTPPEERAALKTAKSQLLRKAQDGVDPAIKAIVDARLNDFLKVDSASQEAVLNGLVADLAALKPRTDLARGDQVLVEAATAIARRQAQQLDAQQVRAKLEVIRLQLTGLSGKAMAQAFRVAAAAVTQNPADVKGNEEGYVESGTYTKDFDAVAFALKPNELSRVFTFGEVSGLLFCIDHKAARTRSFDEVSGQIESVLLERRYAAAKQRAVKILLGKAAIRDLVDLDRLVE